MEHYLAPPAGGEIAPALIPAVERTETRSERVVIDIPRAVFFVDVKGGGAGARKVIHVGGFGHLRADL